MASRRGLGKLRHVELKYLWIQDVVKEGRLKVRKVDGAKNVADHLTKGKSGSEMARMLRGAGAEVEARRVSAEISGSSRRTAKVAD